MTTKSKIYKKPILLGLALSTLMSMSPQMLLAKVNAVGTSRVEITMTAEERKSLLNPVKTEVNNAEMVIIKEGNEVSKINVALNTRGQTSLKKFSRKNLAVKIAKGESNKVETQKGEAKEKQKIEIANVKGKELILSASPEDMLATKNMIVYRLYKLAGIPTLKTAYSEVIINGESEGLYMVTENPKDYLMKELDSDIVIRRRYNDVMDLEKVKKGISEQDAAKYTAEIAQLHLSLRKLNGQELVDTLTKKLDLKEYMQWLAVNYIIQNGDYSDEVFFYGKKDVKTGEMLFRIFPWDLDDTFSPTMHQSIIPGGINTAAEERSRKQMLYSFESRIERAIVGSPELMRMYFSVMEEVVNKLSPEGVRKVFGSVDEKIRPYLDDSDVLNNGLKDSEKKAHDVYTVLTTLQTREQMVNERVAAIKAELDQIKANGEDRSEKINAIANKLGTWWLKLTYKISK